MGRENYDRLQHAAESISARFKMISGWSIHSGEEFLNDAIQSCYSIGENGDCVRRLPPEVSVDAALVMIVRSMVSHAFLSQSRRRRGEMPERKTDLTDKKQADYEPTEVFWEAGGDRMTQEQKEDAAKRFDEFILLVKPDRVIHGMLVLIREEGLDKPASLVASRLGVTESDIFLARKRLLSFVGRYNKMKGANK